MSLQMNRDIHDEEDRDQNEEGEDAMDDPDDDLIDCIKKMSEKPDQQMRRIRCKQGTQFRDYFHEFLGQEASAVMVESENDDETPPCTLMYLLTEILECSHKHDWTKAALDDVLTLVRLGRPAHDRMIIPPSVHLLRKSVCMGSAEDNEIHLCDCGKPFKKLKKIEYERNAEEICEECRAKRFIGVSGRYRPRNFFYYFGVKNAIESLFQFESFRTARGKAREERNGLYMSAYGEWVKEHEPELLQENRSIWSIGVDGAQPFDKRCHSCTQIVIKCEDMGIDGRYKDCHTRTLAIIPGPAEPKDLNPFLCYIGEEIENFRKKGIKISYKEVVNGESQLKEETHFPIWGHIYADAKAREKILLCKPGTACKGCFYCWQISTQIETTSGKRSVPAGWSDEAKFLQILPEEDDNEFWAKRGDQVRNLRASQNELLALQAIMKDAVNNGYKDGKSLAYWQNRLHLNGHAKVFDVVPTLHIQYGIFMPLYHLLLLGLAKRFLTYLLDGFRKKGNSSSIAQSNQERDIRIVNKKLLEAMEKRIFLNSDYRKPYSPVANCYSWICEEVLRFVEVHSLFLFEEEISGQGILSKDALEAWRHLRAFIMYYIRDSPASNTEEGRSKAHDHLRAFGEMCQSKKLCELLTPNLHTSDCQLPFHERFCGSPFMFGDMWVERAMRKIGSTKNKKSPETTLTLAHRRLDALERAKLALGLSLDQEVIPKYRPRATHVYGSEYDRVTEETQTHLLGKGTAKNIESFRDLRYHLGKSAHNQKMVGELKAVENLVVKHSKSRKDLYQKEWIVWEHSAALVNGYRGMEEVKAITHRKENKRRSCFVTVLWEGRSAVAIVLRFIRISAHQESQYDEIYRYAICDIYRTEEKNGAFVATEYQGEDSLFLKKNVAVDLKDIGCKVQYNDFTKDCTGANLKVFSAGNRTAVRRIVFLHYTRNHDMTDLDDAEDNSAQNDP